MSGPTISLMVSVQSCMTLRSSNLGASKTSWSFAVIGATNRSHNYAAAIADELCDATDLNQAIQLWVQQTGDEGFSSSELRS